MHLVVEKEDLQFIMFKVINNGQKKNSKWTSENTEKYLKSAYEALKPGGTLVYSTCTLNRQENENIIEWALDNFEIKQEESKISSKTDDTSI